MVTPLRVLPSTSSGYTQLASARENALVFYNGTTGSILTAALEDRGDITPKSTMVWPVGYTQLTGGPNGGLFLYRTTDGAAGTATISPAGVTTNTSSVGGFAGGHTVANVGAL